jgi:hypothetical protein
MPTPTIWKYLGGAPALMALLALGCSGAGTDPSAGEAQAPGAPANLRLVSNTNVSGDGQGCTRIGRVVCDAVGGAGSYAWTWARDGGPATRQETSVPALDLTAQGDGEYSVTVAAVGTAGTGAASAGLAWRLKTVGDRVTQEGTTGLVASGMAWNGSLTLAGPQWGTPTGRYVNGTGTAFLDTDASKSNVFPPNGSATVLFTSTPGNWAGTTVRFALIGLTDKAGNAPVASDAAGTALEGALPGLAYSRAVPLALGPVADPRP